MEDQLDLIRTQAEEVPQANNLALLIRMLETIKKGHTQLDTLPTELDVDARTVRYYIDLARWLGLLTIPEPQRISLTQIGSVFCDNVQARSRLFRDGLFLQELVQSLHALKREDDDLSTKDAAERVILARTALAPSTAKRRASSLSALLEAAYKPSEFDWQTGAKLKSVTPAVHFDGRAFLTAMAARTFGATSPVAIGFPKQVIQFVRQQSDLSSKWKKAAIDHDGKQWFGSVPLNSSTYAAAKRGGPDLRNILALCVPAVTLAVSLLSWRDAAGRPIARITKDMFGVRVWIRGKEYGSPLDLMQVLAKSQDLEWVDAPKSMVSLPESEAATVDDLLEILTTARFCHFDGTTLERVPQFEYESREASEGASSTHDRLGLIEEMWEQVI